MNQVLDYLIEIVKPLTEYSTIPELERKTISDGYAILLEENKEIEDRVNQSTTLFLATESYLKLLIQQISTIVQPLLTDTTIEKSYNDQSISFKLIHEGYNILLDEDRKLKDRIQEASDRFDEARVRPYNPHHSRNALGATISAYEYFHGGILFTRTKKSED